MKRRSQQALGLLFAIGLTACGDELGADVVPLPDGAQIAAQSYECPVSPTVCRRYVLVRGAPGSEAGQVKAQLLTRLQAAGWTFVPGVTPNQRAADSSDRKLFVSFATANEELDDRPDLLWSEKLDRDLRAAAKENAPVVALTLSKGEAGMGG
jgi:hypothetical protein